MKNEHHQIKSSADHSNSRREFLQKASLGALALGFPFPSFPGFLKEVPMGIVVHSYASRWNSKIESKQYPGFTNAVELLEHCGKIGAGGLQVGVRNWTTDFSKKMRDKREKLGLYLEGSIGIPKNAEGVAAFEKEVIAAKEAGATILRTACLSGRRYESFKTKEAFEQFWKESVAGMQQAEPILSKHKMKLAVENHKDWRAPELVFILKKLDSEWVGTTIDFGNSIALMEDPMEVVNSLAPYIFTTHVKDMGLLEYDKGFLLSEVPLGTGMLDLPRMVDICKKHNPSVTFNLEMITRDPLEIPCLTDEYWATFDGVPGTELARTLRMVREKTFKTELPKVTGLSGEERLAVEESNILESLTYSQKSMGLG